MTSTATTAPGEPTPTKAPAMTWNRKHLLGLEDLAREEVLGILDTAESFAEISKDLSPEKKARAVLFLAKFQNRFGPRGAHGGPGMGPGMHGGRGKGGGMGPGGGQGPGAGMGMGPGAMGMMGPGDGGPMDEDGGPWADDDD